MARRRRRNPPTFISLPPFSTLIAGAHSQPWEIDNLVITYLNSRSSSTDPEGSMLAAPLKHELTPQISRGVTPPILWGGDPSWSKQEYRSCFVHASLLGRAFALCHTMCEETPAEALTKECEELWKVIQDVFIKGLFSEDPEVGAWYAAGILILTCSDALQKQGIMGKGKGWFFCDNKLDKPDATWSWDDLRQAVLATEHLPRDMTRTGYTDEEYRTRKNLVYVPEEVLHVFDLARKNLHAHNPDWNSYDIARAFDD